MIDPQLALVPEILQEIGAVAGIAAFLGITLLAILQFVLARDVRRLRDWAGRAPERDSEFQEATAALAAERAEELRSNTEELPHGDPIEAEARAIQLRAARQRSREDGGGVSRISDSGPAKAAIAVLAVAAVALVTYVAVGQIGGEDEPAQQNNAARGQQANRGGGQGGGGGGSVLDPSQVQVAVLNGTAASGLATAFQDGISAAGYQVGAVGNSQSTFTESAVMFNQGHRPEAVELARAFEIAKVEPMLEEVIAVAEGAPIAVVLGDDKIPAG